MSDLQKIGERLNSLRDYCDAPVLDVPVPDDPSLADILKALGDFRDRLYGAQEEAWGEEL